MKRFVIFLTWLMLVCSYANAQNGYITVSGKVIDQVSKKPLSKVNIIVNNVGFGTVTNDDGDFTIKIDKANNTSFLEFSHLGYKNKKFSIDNGYNDVKIALSPSVINLDDALIDKPEALSIVDKAIRNINKNYTDKNEMLMGFYRETVQKRKNYISIAEALVDVYKTGYNNGINGDKVRIFKGRKLASQKADDTLMVKFEGGPALTVYLDVVKNNAFFLDIDLLPLYSFELDEHTMINNQDHYMIKFSPLNAKHSEDQMYYGYLYINKDNLAITLAEVWVSMENRDKIAGNYIRKKPAGSRFTPEEIAFYVSYKENNGRLRLNYVKNTMRFKFDIKRKLFSTNYAIVSECVIVDDKTENTNKITNREAVKLYDVFSDKVEDFADSNFWENYNILEPTESLETAINKLKKQKN